MTNLKNYYQESLQELQKISNRDKKPSLLLHACCAPCACFPMESLDDLFDITLYYENSNIYPSTEYQKRLSELKDYVDHFNKEKKANIQLICPVYNSTAFTEKLSPLGHLDEGKERCFLCYSLRLEETFRYANENNFDYISTVMTISRHKNSQKLNELGETINQQFPKVKYFFSDFKKNGGQEFSTAIAREHQMYRQSYCGCIYSYEKSLKVK